MLAVVEYDHAGVAFAHLVTCRTWQQFVTVTETGNHECPGRKHLAQILVDEQAADGAVGGEAVLDLSRAWDFLVFDDLTGLRAQFRDARPGFVLGGDRAISFGLFSPRPLRFQLDFAVLLRPFAVPCLVLLAGNLGYFGFLDQARLEQLFLEWIRLGHVSGFAVGISGPSYLSSSKQSLALLPMEPLKYLTGYPPHVLAKVQALIVSGRLGTTLAEKYVEPHTVRNDGQLYDYVAELKDRHLRKSVPLGKVIYDGKLQVMKHALGTHTSISRVQGSKLKASREIRIASVFRDAPAEFLKMIVVHELAHLKETEHNKPFYRLCTHMEPDYHQLEFDLRLYLTHLDASNHQD